jgi:hypothetical protein
MFQLIELPRKPTHTTTAEPKKKMMNWPLAVALGVAFGSWAAFSFVLSVLIGLFW